MAGHIAEKLIREYLIREGLYDHEVGVGAGAPGTSPSMTCMISSTRLAQGSPGEEGAVESDNGSRQSGFARPHGNGPWI